MRDAQSWGSILTACGVAKREVDKFAPLFATYAQPESFSLAGRELPSFLGQVLHESGLLTAVQENLFYRAARIVEMGNAAPAGSRWRSLVPRATELAGNPEAMANAAYDGRGGNTQPGDGWKYRGRGLVQATFRDNYALLQQLTGLPLLDDPDLLLDPANALRASVAWWEKRVPDSAIGDIERETKAVNGGVNGLAHRETLTGLACAALARFPA